MSIEEKYLNQVASSLPFYSRQLNSYRFQCPYCQHGSKDHKGRKMTAGRCKGFMYSVGNALNYKCHLCKLTKQFHCFLEDHFPKAFLAYVAEREAFGLTGKSTNAPLLSNAMSRVSVSTNDGFDAAAKQNVDCSTSQPTAAASIPFKSHQASGNASTASTSPQKKIYPRLTPQQQAGAGAAVAHKVKQHQQRRCIDPADRLLKRHESQ
jgi:hypothetical protein